MSECSARRLQDQRGDIVVGRQQIRDTSGIVRRDDKRVLNHPRRNAGRAARRERNLVVPSVKMARETDYLALAGESARKAERQVRGLGSGSRKAHLRGGRNHLLHQFRPLDFERMRCPIVRAFSHLGRDGIHHQGMIVTEDERTVPSQIVHVLVAVHVPFARTRGPFDVHRMRLQVSAEVRDAVGQQRPGACGQHSRARCLIRVGAQDVRSLQRDRLSGHASYVIADRPALQDGLNGA